MSRQTTWGGAGKPPSRNVMAAAGKAARTEMLQRVREKKASDGGGSSSGQRQRPTADVGENSQPRGQGEQQRQAPRGDGRRAGGRNGSAGGNGGGGNGGGANRLNLGPPRHAEARAEARAERAPRDDRAPRKTGVHEKTVSRARTANLGPTPISGACVSAIHARVLPPPVASPIRCAPASVASADTEISLSLQSLSVA